MLPDYTPPAGDTSADTAIIDARGMVVARTPWWEKATLKGKVHLRRGQTFFARNGDYLGRMSLIGAGLLALYAGIRRARQVVRDE